MQYGVPSPQTAPCGHFSSSWADNLGVTSPFPLVRYLVFVFIRVYEAVAATQSSVLQKEVALEANDGFGSNS